MPVNRPSACEREADPLSLGMAEGGSTRELPGVADAGPVTELAEGMLATLQATGVSWHEAMGQTVAVFGADAVRPSWDKALPAVVMDERVLWALDGVAQDDPVAANAWLNNGLVSGQIREWLSDAFAMGYFMAGLNWIRTIPDGTQVAGSLDLGSCTSLAGLPDGLEIGGDLRLEGCVALTSTPANLRVGGDLRLAGCRALVCIAEGLEVGLNLDAPACESLVRLPSKLVVKGDLELSQCVALALLPDDLRVAGSFTLHGCAALRALPKGLQVGGWLDLRGCASWDGKIPTDASIERLVATDRHPNGIPLDEWRVCHPDGRE